MFGNILIWYFTIALAIFGVWLGLFLLDDTTPNNHLISWIVLLIAPLFWPIVLPLSIRELVMKMKIKQQHQEYNKRQNTVLNLKTQELNTHWREGL